MGASFQRWILGGAALLAGAGCVALGLLKADYHPDIDPANFQSTVDGVVAEALVSIARE